MKRIVQKRIVLFKIKASPLNLLKIVCITEAKTKNLIFYLFGVYSKIFFDFGLNVFGTMPYWISQIVSFVKMREFFFFKVFSWHKKTNKLVENYSIFFNNVIKRSKQGFFLEFKVIGYFRAKRIALKYSKKKYPFLLLYFGYSHLIYAILSKNVSFVRGKKRFMFFTTYKQDFERIVKQIFMFKPFNIYKNKGIRTYLNIKKMKPGKQKQQKKVVKK